MRIPRPLRPPLKRLADRLARLAGYDLVWRGVYSPVPEVPPPDSPEWGRVFSLAGLDFDLARQLAWVERVAAPWFGEIAPPRQPPFGIQLDNRWYGHLDALLLWGAVRGLRPARVLELGAGHSTLLMLGALEANGAGAIESVDPEPRLPAASLAHPRLALERRSARELPLDRFLALGAGDLLFVDTSHTVKRGSEVVRLVLEVLPRLAPGVVVHFHDIHFPWDYPRELFARGTYLAEQYLVQAYLAENPHWRILAAADALARTFPAELGALAPGVALAASAGHGASALWLERLG